MSASEFSEVLLRARHPNGYIREAAVHQLATLTSGEELSPLLERANDWVPPVRRAAQTALVARLTPAYAYPLACVLNDIEGLSRLHRDNHAPFIRAVHRLLLSSEGEAALLRACETAPSLARRHCRHLAATQLQGERGVEWLARALSDESYWLRGLAVRHAAQISEGEQLVAWTREQSQRTPGQIAQRLLYALVERFPELAPPVLAELTLSPYGNLRRAAQFYFQPKEALAAHYRVALPHPSAVLGLGEIGEKEALSPLLVLREHPSPTVRKAALQSIGRLGAEAHKPLLLAGLSDPTPGMRRVARLGLRGHITPSDEPLLLAANEQRLLEELPFWQALSCFVEQGALAPLEKALRRRTAVLPTQSQWERLAEALAASPALPAPLRLRLQQELVHAETLLRHRSASCTRSNSAISSGSARA